MSTPLASAHAIIRSRPDAPLPDLKLQLHHFSGKDRMAYSKDLGIDPHPGLTIGVVQLSPRSRGRLHIASPDANIAPRIYTDQFEDEEEDRKRVVKGQSVSERVELGGRRNITQKKNNIKK